MSLNDKILEIEKSQTKNVQNYLLTSRGDILIDTFYTDKEHIDNLLPDRRFSYAMKPCDEIPPLTDDEYGMYDLNIEKELLSARRPDHTITIRQGQDCFKCVLTRYGELTFSLEYDKGSKNFIYNTYKELKLIPKFTHPDLDFNLDILPNAELSRRFAFPKNNKWVFNAKAYREYIKNHPKESKQTLMKSVDNTAEARGNLLLKEIEERQKNLVLKIKENQNNFLKELEYTLKNKSLLN